MTKEVQARGVDTMNRTHLLHPSSNRPLCGFVGLIRSLDELVVIRYLCHRCQRRQKSNKE